MTNVEKVTNMMENSKYGVLAQAFIIEAIAKYAEQVKDADPKVFENSVVHGESWIGCANELFDKVCQ